MRRTARGALVALACGLVACTPAPRDPADGDVTRARATATADLQRFDLGMRDPGAGVTDLMLTDLRDVCAHPQVVSAQTHTMVCTLTRTGAYAVASVTDAKTLHERLLAQGCQANGQVTLSQWGEVHLPTLPGGDVNQLPEAGYRCGRATVTVHASTPQRLDPTGGRSLRADEVEVSHTEADPPRLADARRRTEPALVTLAAAITYWER